MSLRWCGDTDQHPKHEDPDIVSQSCPGWPEDGAKPSAEQVLARLRVEADPEAVEWLTGILSTSEDGQRCFLENHRDQIDRLRHQIAVLEARHRDPTQPSWADGVTE